VPRDDLAGANFRESDFRIFLPACSAFSAPSALSPFSALVGLEADRYGVGASMPKLTKPRFVIAVPNLQKSAAFYRDVLGFEVQTVSDPGWLFFRCGDCVIMAGECPGAIPPSDLGDHSYFAYLNVEGIDAYYASVRAAGGRVCKPLRAESWEMREFGVVTTDGHRIMFGESIR
jgi:catechol 2,3-dioxygenase-like lactoylglutathione lyase family enzyme